MNFTRQGDPHDTTRLPFQGAGIGTRAQVRIPIELERRDSTRTLLVRALSASLLSSSVMPGTTRSTQTSRDCLATVIA